MHLRIHRATVLKGQAQKGTLCMKIYHAAGKRVRMKNCKRKRFSTSLFNQLNFLIDSKLPESYLWLRAETLNALQKHF